jgi:hypothetical protein
MCEQESAAGFEVWHTPSEQEQRVFARVTERFQSVRYRPCSCATEVAAGTRYSFLCAAEYAAETAGCSLVKLRVFEPLHGPNAPIEIAPILLSIETIEP